MLDTIKTGVEKKPHRLLIYGPGGIGKTTFAAASPHGAVIVQTEDGAGLIDCARFPVATSFDAVMSALRSLATDEHPYGEVVIDSLDWLEPLVWAETCTRKNAPSIEAIGGGYGKGYVEAVYVWQEFISALDHLRTKCGLHITLIAHAGVERVEDPEADTYTRVCPKIHKKASAIFVEWADAVLYASRQKIIKKTDEGFSRERVRAVAGARVLRCVDTPAACAKNRFGLPDVIAFDGADSARANFEELLK